MAIELPLNSRYLHIDPIKYQGRETLAWWPGADWLDSAPVQTVVINRSFAGRADLIANQYLGSSDLWWVILYYNRVTDINWPRPGDEVQIPNSNLVLGT